MSHKVFAYGSNMCSGRLREYGVSLERAGRATVLTRYRLLFNKKSTKDNSGMANVEPYEASDVCLLYTISDSDLPRLDEGAFNRARTQIDFGATLNSLFAG
jgi:hypothetical protein